MRFQYPCKVLLGKEKLQRKTALEFYGSKFVSWNSGEEKKSHKSIPKP